MTTGTVPHGDLLEHGDRSRVGPGLRRVMQHELVDAHVLVGPDELVELVERREHGLLGVHNRTLRTVDGSRPHASHAASRRAVCRRTVSKMSAGVRGAPVGPIVTHCCP